MGGETQTQEHSALGFSAHQMHTPTLQGRYGRCTTGPTKSVSRRSVAVAGGAPRPTAVMRAFLGTEAPEWSGSLRQRYTAEPAPWAHVRTIHEE